MPKREFNTNDVVSFLTDKNGLVTGRIVYWHSMFRGVLDAVSKETAIPNETSYAIDTDKLGVIIVNDSADNDPKLVKNTIETLKYLKKRNNKKRRKDDK
jgi:hypothetical protein